MINIKKLQTKQDFESLQPKDKIVIKYLNGKMYFLEVIRIDNDDIVGKIDTNWLQETFVNIDSLINRDLGKYIECVVKLI